MNHAAGSAGREYTQMYISCYAQLTSISARMPTLRCTHAIAGRNTAWECTCCTLDWLNCAQPGCDGSGLQDQADGCHAAQVSTNMLCVCERKSKLIPNQLYHPCSFIVKGDLSDVSTGSNMLQNLWRFKRSVVHIIHITTSATLSSCRRLLV